jgi:uncharacterized protein (TIGR02284 family)
MQKHERNIEVLNSLIQTTIDSVDGYERAAEVADDAALSDLFRQFASDRRDALATLRNQVERLGGDPEDDGSMLAAAHRTFLNLRRYVQVDRKAAIMEVERGEDFIKTKYEEAIDDSDISEDVRDTISDCYDTVLRGHDAASDLKRALGA